MANKIKDTAKSAKVVASAEQKTDLAAKALATEAARKLKTETSLTIDVFGLDGKVVETMSLPSEIFGKKVNKTLLNQAVRVYLANQRSGSASTKTRGQVTGSTRKIYRQKGTGRARHGGITAPIFVGGGIAHGPKPHDFSLSLPQKMKKAAMYSALADKFQTKHLSVVKSLESVSPKTKEMVNVLKTLQFSPEKQSLLVVLSAGSTQAARALRNIQGVTYAMVNNLNAYEVLMHKRVLFVKDALSTFEKKKSEEAK